MSKDNFKFNPPYFTGYVQPYGYFDSSREVHALWYYYLAARGAYERIVKDPIVLEGRKDPTANFRQLFTSIARMYDVNPDAMAKCWDLVDAQCWSLQLPKMPDEERYRFDRRIIIETTTKLH